MGVKTVMVTGDNPLTAKYIAEKAGVEEEPTKFDKWLEKKLGHNMMKVLGGFAAVLGVALAAVLLVLTRWCKPTKGLHPIVFILASAIIGVVFSF